MALQEPTFEDLLMTPSAVVDTHAAVWYLNADRRLSDRAKRFIDTSSQDGRT